MKKMCEIHIYLVGGVCLFLASNITFLMWWSLFISNLQLVFILSSDVCLFLVVDMFFYYGGACLSLTRNIIIFCQGEEWGMCGFFFSLILALLMGLKKRRHGLGKILFQLGPVQKSDYFSKSNLFLIFPENQILIKIIGLIIVRILSFQLCVLF